jgi:hypothetical protein
LVCAIKVAPIEKGMKQYVLANIKIPIIVNEDGLFDMLNEYTQTEITSLNQLPTIEEEDNLYKKIMEFLSKKDDDLEEEPVRKIKIRDDIEETTKEGLEDDNEEEEEEEEKTSEKTSEGSDSCFATKEETTKETVEQVLTICKNNIKMRKHSDNMTFKNIKKGAKSYTRKMYE